VDFRLIVNEAEKLDRTVEGFSEHAEEQAETVSL